MTFVQELPAAAVERGAARARITGTFLRRNAVSLNDRLYPADTVDRVVAKAQARLQQSGPRGIPLQMLARHASMDEDQSGEVVGRITDVWLDGDDAKYAAEIPDTGLGRDYATLIQGGYINTVSLRAEPESAKSHKGKLDDREIDVIDDFDLAGIDFTLYPGIRDAARVESIEVFESVDPSRLAATLTEEYEPGKIARAWYETWLAADDRLAGTTIDAIERDYLPLTEARFQQPGHYTKKDRDTIAAADFAGPNQTFPIVTQQDVHDAARLIGHAANPAAVKRRVVAIAKRKGFSLPDAWQNPKKENSPMPKKAAAATEQADRSTPLDALVEALKSLDGAQLDPAVADALAGLSESLREDGDDGADDAAESAREDDDAGDDDAGESAREDGGGDQDTGDDAMEAARGHREALKKVHGAVAKALRMSCAEDDDSGDDGATESGREDDGDDAGSDDQSESVRAMVKQVVKEALAEMLPGSRTAEARPRAKAPAKAASAARPRESRDPLAQAILELAKGQQRLSEAVARVATEVPKQAAKAAAEAAWRPQRKTTMAENRDAEPGVDAAASAEPAILTKLYDRSVPIESRFRMAADQLVKQAPATRLLAALGLDEE